MNKKMESAVTIVFLVQKQTHPGILPVEIRAVVANHRHCKVLNSTQQPNPPDLKDY
jgi:hypothetical protein